MAKNADNKSSNCRNSYENVSGSNVIPNNILA